MPRSVVKCHFVLHQFMFGHFKTKTVKLVSSNNNLLTGTHSQKPFIKVKLKNSVILNSIAYKGKRFFQLKLKTRQAH